MMICTISLHWSVNPFTSGKIMSDFVRFSTKVSHNNITIFSAKPWSKTFAGSAVYTVHRHFHIQVKGVKIMDDINILTVRIPREDKSRLMEYAKTHDCSASQIIRYLIRRYLFE